MSKYENFLSIDELPDFRQDKVRWIQQKIIKAVSRGKKRVIINSEDFPEDVEVFIQALRNKKYEVEFFGCEECPTCQECKRYIIRWE